MARIIMQSVPITSVEDVFPPRKDFLAPTTGRYEITGQLAVGITGYRVEFPKSAVSDQSIKEMRDQIGEEVRINAPHPIIGRLTAVEESADGSCVRLTVMEAHSELGSSAAH